MIKLRMLLLLNKTFYILLILVSLISIIRLTYPYKSKFNKDETSIKGVITDIYQDGPYLKLTINSKEKIIGTYYFRNEFQKKNTKINLGDTISLKGNLEAPSNNTVFNTLNYKKYLKKNKMFYTFSIESFQVEKKNKNIYYLIKNKLINHISKYKTEGYLKAFIIGDTSSIDKNTYKSFQEIGISHLFAISGMHISFLSGLVLTILKKLKVEETKRYVITTIFLFLYLLLAYSPSVLRSFLFFFLCFINKNYYFHIKITNIFILTLSISLLINPFFIYNIGFIFSYSISFILIYLSEWLQKGNKLIQSIKVSLSSFIISIPTCIYFFYQINILTPIFNLFFVPFISLCIFPLSFIVLIFPKLDSLYLVLLKLFENIVFMCNKISVSKIIFSKPSIYLLLGYLIILVIIFSKKKNKYLILLLLLCIFNKSIPNIKKETYVITMDVGQGDSSLIHINNKNILIDSGGKISNSSYKRTNSSTISDQTITMLKSIGISKLNTIIITHGDYDHMGEAINLVNNFKVDKVIFNCGPYNYLEKELIKVLNEKKIKYYSCINELNIDNNKLYFLQTKEYDNENDNSNVIYTELNNYKFLFMGDAGVDKEKDILDEYDLSDIDVLKVGHHGSKTSSSKEFIDEIKPKYSIVSVGKNNRYGHPNKEVLKNLDNSKIYRTDQDGSIMFKIKNNKLKTDICSP